MAYPPVAVLPFRLEPAVSLAAYAIGDVVSTLQTLRKATYATSDRAATLENLTVVNFGNSTLQLRFHLFSEAPDPVPADNAPFDISSADVRTKYLGYFETDTSDWVDMTVGGSTRKVATWSGVALDAFSTALNNLNQRTDDLYLLLETRRVVTFSATNDLLLILNFRT